MQSVIGLLHCVTSWIPQRLLKPDAFPSFISHPDLLLPVPAHVSSRSSSPDRDQTPRPVVSLALYVNSRDAGL